MPLTKIDTGAIKDDAINSAKIADGTVVASDVLDNTITGAKLASDIAISTSGNITTTGALTSTGIDDNATSTAITIDSSQNVGIDNTIPGSFNSSANQLVVGSGSGQNGITIYSGTSNNGSIHFGDGTGASSYRGSINYYHNGDTLGFNVSASEGMRLTSTGLGIGTTSPSTLLHLKSNNAEILFEDSNPDDTREAKIHTNAGDLIFQVGDDLTGTPTVDGQLTMFDGGSLIYSQSGTARFNINISGDVGIGTTSPNALLDLGGAGSSFQSGHEKITIAQASSPYGYYPSLSGHNRSYLHLTGSGGGSAFNTSIHGYQVANPAGGNYMRVAPDLTNNYVLYHKTDVTGFKWYADYNKSSGDADFTPSEEVSFNFATDTGAIVFNESSRDRDFRVESNNNTHMLFVDGGNDNVGIGTSSPWSNVKLDVNGNAKLSDGSTLYWSDGNTGITNSGGNIIFKTFVPGSFDERVRIASDGKVGIGTTSPTALLHVENSSNANILIKNPTNGNDASLNINKAGSSSRAIIRFQSSNTWHVGSTRNTTTGFAISTNDDFNSSSEFRLTTSGLTLTGSLSKGSGSFKIDHPLPEKTNTHHLVHSFVESPQANNIYRGKVDLVSGTATVNIDTVSGMTEGTFVLLNRDIQCFTSNETGWTAVKGSVSGNTLTITAQDNTCTDTISWMVIGERQDQHMYDTDWTDDNGKVIVEPLK